MAEHVDIPDGERHEPKGASTAVDGSFNKSNGDGTTQWSLLGLGDLQDVSIMPFQADIVDPPTATAEDVANAVNNLLAKLIAAGLMEAL